MTRIRDVRVGGEEGLERHPEPLCEGAEGFACLDNVGLEGRARLGSGSGSANPSLLALTSGPPWVSAAA